MVKQIKGNEWRNVDGSIIMKGRGEIDRRDGWFVQPNVSRILG